MHRTAGMYTTQTAVSRQQKVFGPVRPAKHVCRRSKARDAVHSTAPEDVCTSPVINAAAWLSLQEKSVEELAQVAGQDPKAALPAYMTEEGCEGKG